jgi:hypothetical protein
MLAPTVTNWLLLLASSVKPLGVELFGDGNTPLESSNVTAIAHDEPPVDSTAKLICCGVTCQFACFHGDEPELAAPVLEWVCNQATIMEQPAMTAQPPSNEVVRTIEMFRPKRKGRR